MNTKKLTALIIGLLALMIGICAAAETLDYSAAENWAYYEQEADRPVDVFFIAPTNVMGSADELICDLSSENDRFSICAAIGMQTGIYNETGRFFAPYYRQITMAAYELEAAEREEYLLSAYADVRAAFVWYMENANEGRPFIIAGFSQGADHGLRLLKEFGSDPAFADKMIAAYLIGWPVTPRDIEEFPHLKPAQGETDTGVIITFECEAEDINDTLIVPAGVFTYSINPLNWKTDATPASKDENLGFVIPNADGSVASETANFCGAVIDPERGTVKIPDISAADYPAMISIIPEGSYHIYDYLFFYRNLQQNVKVRTQAYLNR